MIEVMVSAAIFAFALLGLFGMGRMMQRSAVNNVADGVALHAVEGMMEQLRVLPYEAVLLPAAQVPPALPLGQKWVVSLKRYQPPRAGGVAGKQVEQLIPINTTGADKGITTYTDKDGEKRKCTIDAEGYVMVDDVNMASTLNSTFAVVTQQPMKLKVRILMYEVKDANFATGVTLEILYKYQAAPPGTPDTDTSLDTVSSRATRTFIPRKIT